MNEWITLFKVSYVIVKLHNSSHLLKVCVTNANRSIIIMTIISDILKMFVRAYSLIINKINRSLYIIWLLEEITNNSNKYCIFWLTFQSPLSKFNNQIMYKLLFILFINIWHKTKKDRIAGYNFVRDWSNIFTW